MLKKLDGTRCDEDARLKTWSLSLDEDMYEKGKAFLGSCCRATIKRMVIC